MNNLIIYPEYDMRIARNNDYEVTVSQGEESAKIPVYNEVRQHASVREPWGDDYRRFCEFAFEGEPVRVDITVNMSFAEYTVMPAMSNLKTEVHGNVISVWIDKPQNFMVRLEDKIRTMIAVFADAPETDIPDRNDPSVVYIEGWYENDDKLISMKSGQTLYIAPGSVCNARIEARNAENIKICGRGMVHDPHDTRTYNVHSKTEVICINGCNNIVIKDIKNVDAHFYHIMFGASSNALVENVRMLSNIISTDAVTIVNSHDFVLRNIYVDVCDDVSTIHGNIENMLYENWIIGTTCGVFSTVGMKKNVIYRNFSIFRANEAIFKNYYTNKPDNEFGGVLIENMTAVDCVFLPVLLSSLKQGSGLKKFIFKNFTSILPSGNSDRGAKRCLYDHRLIEIRKSDNIDRDFEINLENCIIDGKLLTSADDVIAVTNGAENFKVNVTVNEETLGKLPTKSTTYKLENPYVAPAKVYAPYKLGENLLENGGFEYGIREWGTEAFLHAYLSDVAHSGKYSMLMPCVRQYCGTSRDLGEIFRRAGNGRYRISFWTKLAPDSVIREGDCLVGINHGEATGTTFMPYMTVKSKFEVDDDWTEHSFEFDLGLEPEAINNAELKIRNFFSETLNMYLDDVKVEKIAE